MFNQNSLAPIVLFVYNRPWHTQQTINSLKNNGLADKSELFIFSDGAKNDYDRESVNEVRDYIKTINGFNNVFIIEKDKNWGLANSVIDGVTRIVNEYGKVIVLEDDMVTSPYFLEYMNDALELYKDHLKIFGITGYAYPINNKNIPETYFMKDEGCWGWGTWARAWKYFEKDTEKLLQVFSPQMIEEFNFDSTTDFWNQIILNFEGKIDTWAIYWYATIFLNDGLFLHPRESFIKNIGHDGSGINCTSTNDFDNQLIIKYKKKFPSDIKVCIDAREEHKLFFKKQNSIINKIKRKISIALGYTK